MKRRAFITGLGAIATPLLLPRAARGQQAMPVVGFLSNVSADNAATFVDAFRLGLKESGFTEGQNAAIEFRYAENQNDRLPALLNDLIARKPAVIVTAGATSAAAAKLATSTVPIVFFMGEDPVSLGLVPSFNRPGGNMTGVAQLASVIMAKRMELLRELVPNAPSMAVLINPDNPAAKFSINDAQDMASKLGQKVHILTVSTESEFENVFASLARLQAGALVIAPDGLFVSRAGRLAALAARHRIPASHERRAFPDAGGLMSYGGNQSDGIRQVGVYAGRILKGEKPADLPVMQPTKFELVINLKTAKALGLTVPPTLLVAADEVIE